MDKTPYRVGAGANLALYPRGTKVGDVVHLTDGEALYERDMGRIVPVADEVKTAPADGIEKTAVAGDTIIVPGETKGHPVDAATGQPSDLSDEERAAIQAGPDIGAGSGETALGQGQASGTLSAAEEIDRIDPKADPGDGKARKGR